MVEKVNKIMTNFENKKGKSLDYIVDKIHERSTEDSEFRDLLRSDINKMRENENRIR